MPSRKFLIPTSFVILLTFLAACASFQPDLTPSQRVYAAKSELRIALQEVVNYASEPPCGDGVVVACHDPSVVQTMTSLAHDARTALDEAEAIVVAVEDDPNLTDDSQALVYVATARAALSRLATLLVAREG